METPSYSEFGHTLGRDNLLTPLVQRVPVDGRDDQEETEGLIESQFQPASTVPD